MSYDPDFEAIRRRARQAEADRDHLASTLAGLRRAHGETVKRYRDLRARVEALTLTRCDCGRAAPCRHCEPEPYCGALQPDPGPRFIPYACIRQAGHGGKHGYAGIFWDNPQPVTADEVADWIATETDEPMWSAVVLARTFLARFHVTRRADA